MQNPIMGDVRRSMRKVFAVFIAALLLVLVAPAAAAVDGELLYNGDFAVSSDLQDLPAGWYLDAWIPDGSDAYMQEEADGGTSVVLDNFQENDARICQRVEVQPNTCYKLSCDIYAQGILGGTGATISVLDTFSSSEQFFDTDGYQHAELVGVTGPDQTELVLALRIGGYGSLSSGQASFQNVSMTEENNPPAAPLSFEALEYDGGGSTDEQQTEEAPNWAILLLVVALSGFAFAYAYQRGIVGTELQQTERTQSRSRIVVLMFFALLVRALLSLAFVGHSTDIGCFLGWSDGMAEFGPAGFYTKSSFADYPPGYMYVLWFFGTLRRLLGLDYGNAFYIFLIKLPAILADLLTAYIVYRLALRKGAGERKAMALLSVMLFHPVFAFVSGGWGQIDSLLALGLFGVVYLFDTDRRILAGALFGLTILLKPQALMAGPLLAAAYLWGWSQETWKKRAKEAALAVLAAVAVIVLLALPFGSGQEPNWLLEKYFSTATSYPYASIEAFNLAALFSGNWKAITSVPLLFSFATWGYIGIALSLVFSIGLYVAARKRKQEGALYLALAFLITALFTLGPYMHERYLFPALLSLIVAALYYDDRRLYIAFFWLSIALLFNTLCAFVIVDHQQARTTTYDALTLLGSLVSVTGFVYLALACKNIVFRGRTLPTVRESTPGDNREQSKFVRGTKRAVRVPKYPDERRHRLYCWGLTLLYACFALTNLGALCAPESEYVSGEPGQIVTLRFEKQAQLSEFWIFGGIAEGTVLVEGQDGGQVSYDQVYDDMFRWHRVEANLTASELTLTTYSGELRIREMAFFDTDGNLLPVQAADTAGEAIVDEQNTVPTQPSYLNGMYFDELYHARTAYEHLHGMDPYENSHPPLGKVFIMLGIALFGMNAFGWRIIGALFGIAMVPIFYALCKRLFRKPEYALLGSVLFAFDFMHFTQTRIATIDVYAVFFILLMFYFMHRYYEMNFFDDGLMKTLKPLALAGLFFGLGAASKWICIYAGGGLAVLLLFSFVSRYKEYKKAVTSGDSAQKQRVKLFWKNTVYTLLWCCLFYIAVPIAIYLLSYMPYYLCDKHYGIMDVWNYQKFMWSYHSGLKATHPYSSTWWQWPFTIKPMWYYLSDSTPAGSISTLTASGNPAVWWVCSIAAVWLAISRITNKIKSEPGIMTVFVGICANLLPWVLVTRCTFIYHFFATVPFIILSGVYLLRSYEERRPELYWVKWVWMAACVVLFLLLYPGLSGLQIPIWYAKILRFLPGGNLLYGV